MNDHKQDRGVEGKITLNRTSRKRWFKGVHCTEMAQNKDCNGRLPSSQWQIFWSHNINMSIYDFWDMAPYSLVDW